MSLGVDAPCRGLPRSLSSCRNAASAAISERSISCPPRCQCVSTGAPCAAEPVLERAGLLRRADRVALAGGDQHPRRHRRRLRRPGDQRVHQHRPSKRSRPREDHAREDVRAVRVAEADHPRRPRRRDVRLDEARHRRGRAGEVGHVVDALAACGGRSAARRARETSPRGATIAAPGRSSRDERHELVLGAAGAVEGEDQRPARSPAPSAW